VIGTQTDSLPEHWNHNQLAAGSPLWQTACHRSLCPWHYYLPPFSNKFWFKAQPGKVVSSTGSVYRTLHQCHGRSFFRSIVLAVPAILKPDTGWLPSLWLSKGYARFPLVFNIPNWIWYVSNLQYIVLSLSMVSLSTKYTFFLAEVLLFGVFFYLKWVTGQTVFFNSSTVVRI
jgi:hypothetical protein